MTSGSPNDDHSHDVNPFEAPQLPEPDRPKSLLKRLLPHLFAIFGLLVALVVGVVSGFVSCLGVVVVFSGALLPLGALLGMIVTAVVVVSIYRWSLRVSESIRDQG